MKKLLSLLLVISMIFSTNIMIYGAENKPSDWAKEDVMEAINRGYVPEHLQNNYQQPITREEFAELFVKTIFNEVNNNYGSCHEDTKSGWDFRILTPENFLSKVTTTEYFTDTDNPYVKIANILGIVDGVGNHEFNPNGLITREQAAIMTVNYLQTIFSGDRDTADVELSDIDEVSSWAKNAVRCAYGMQYIEGIKKPIYNDYGNIIVKGSFDPKGYLTREQAIKILLQPAESLRLHYLILRGYVNISMDELMSGFEIDGDTVKMKKSGYDNKYSLGYKFFERRYKLKKFVGNHTSEEIDSLTVMPYNTDHEMYEPDNIEKVFSGNIVTYDYVAFTITYNNPGYLAIIKKSEGYDYFTGGYLLIYYTKENNTAEYVKCKSITEH